ncbi:MAG: DUF4241 domain-containing protein [Rivularia sp. (in: Bacteria)]|nr:DUF4241 domain-containing protein [Rivularia sp. MS3]
MLEEEYTDPVLKHTDFSKAFEELYFHQLTIPGINIRNNFEVQEIGELVVTSGKLFSWDWNPLFTLENLKDWKLRRKVLNVNIAPGCYPVIVSLLNEPKNNTTTKTIACVMLRLRNQPAVEWELARCIDKSLFAYGEEFVTSSFMDIDAAIKHVYLHKLRQSRILNDRDDLNYREEKILEFYNIEILEFYEAESLEKQEYFDERLEKSMWKQMEKNKIRDGFEWANIQVAQETEANIITFDSSGANSYASYIGYDVTGNIVNVVTDFFVMSDFDISEEYLQEKE